jgi:DNA-binding transcriptional LysR family regulator
MKNGYSYFGCDPSFRMSSFSAILEAMADTGLSGVAPHFMAAEFDQFELLQSNNERRVREVWMLVHETRKSDIGIRNTCKWIEETFSKIAN